MAHRQQALMSVSERVGYGRFRFYLQNATGGKLELLIAPDGWDGAKFQLKRNEKYLGLFRSISFNDLIFRKAARDYIQSVYDGQGINAIITFTVDRMDDDTGAFVNYFTGKLDLSTYKIDRFGVMCQVIDTAFHEKIKSRENSVVDLMTRVSVEGYEIPEFSAGEPQRVQFPAYNIQGAAAWAVNDPASINDKSHHAPMLLGTTDYAETQSQTIAGADPFFSAAAAGHTFTISGNIAGIVICNEEAHTVMVSVYLKKNGIVQAVLIHESGSDVYDLPFSGTFSESITIIATDILSIETAITGAVSDPTTTYYSVQVSISENISSLLTISAVAFPIYEALLRCCQLISDKDDVLKSTFFGRTDTPVVTYAADGQFGHLTKGLFIRNSSGLNATLPTTFYDLFKSLSSIFCLGMGIETISGVEKIVIENIQYFFDSAVVLDLSGSVNEETIGKEIYQPVIFSRISSGYSSFEYDQQGGLAEYNTKNEYTTVISVLDRLLDIVCKYRGDTNGIIKLRTKHQESDDVKGDEDLFLVDSVRQTLSPYWIARTSEGFTTVSGGIDADSNYNLAWTPARNLRRWGAYIRAGLEKNLGTYIRWQTSEKNTTLQTLLTTETEAVVENDDVLVNDLAAPFFLPEIYTVECEMRYADIATLLTNSKGLIKLAENKYGWIMELSIGAKENKAEIRLLRANLDVITPIFPL